MTQVTVTQADREAAAEYETFQLQIAGWNKIDIASHVEPIINGGSDTTGELQIFARHRTQSVEQALAPWVESVEGLLAHSCVSESAPEDKLPEDHAAESKARALLATRKETGRALAGGTDGR